MLICLQNVHVIQWIYLFISSIVSCLCVDSMSNNGALVGNLRGIVNFETFDTGFRIINEYYQKIIKNTAKRFNIFFLFFQS